MNEEDVKELIFLNGKIAACLLILQTCGLRYDENSKPQYRKAGSCVFDSDEILNKIENLLHNYEKELYSFSRNNICLCSHTLGEYI